jgi:hypothetical protein
MVPAVAALVADPPRVDVGILPGLEPVDGVLVVLGVDGAARRAAAADVGLTLQEPDPLLVEEVLVAERPHRAEIDHVAGELVGQRMAGEDVDLLLRPAAGDHQLSRARNLPREPHAAGAHDAAVDEQRDRGADVSLAAVERLQVGAALGLAVLEVVVLQQALARLVADRAVDRVVDEQRLLDPGPAVLDELALGDDHGAVLDRRLAARHELGHHRDLARGRVPLTGFDQAHPAAGHDRQAGMPAVVRDLLAGAAGRLDAVEPLVGPDLDLLSVDDHQRHQCAPTICRAGTGSVTIQPEGLVRLT